MIRINCLEGDRVDNLVRQTGNLRSFNFLAYKQETWLTQLTLNCVTIEIMKETYSASSYLNLQLRLLSVTMNSCSWYRYSLLLSACSSCNKMHVNRLSCPVWPAQQRSDWFYFQSTQISLQLGVTSIFLPWGSHRGVWAHRCEPRPGLWGNHWRLAPDQLLSTGLPEWPPTRGWRTPVYAAPSTGCVKLK